MNMRIRTTIASHRLTLLLLPLVAISECSKVIFIGHRPAKSHFISFVPIVEVAAQREHNVTFISYFPFKYLEVENLLLEPSKRSFGDPEALKKFVLNAPKGGAAFRMTRSVDFAETGCESLLKSEHSQKLLASGKQYDVAIVDALFGECPAVFASLIARHIIFYYTSGWCLPWTNHLVPTPFSFVPNSLELLPSHMNFWQRLQNTLTHLDLRYVQKYYLKAVQQDVISKYLPEASSIDNAETLVDFSLINGDPVTTSPRPSVPNVAYIGGTHQSRAKPLPKVLRDFVDSCNETGFIVFSLGSIVKSEFMPTQFLDSVISAFSRLNQKVLWKFEDEQLAEKVSDNVKIMQWLPQQDLLGHPNARLFITHAGLLGLQEAIFHGVPVIGIPFYADQHGNIARIQELGIGEVIEYSDITADNFYSTIRQILDDKSYYKNMKKYSAIFRDQPQKATDTAIYWIEYVVRHDGAKHLRPAGEGLNILQYFLLDVILCVLVGLITALGTFIYLSKLSWRIILMACKRSAKDSVKKRK